MNAYNGFPRCLVLTRKAAWMVLWLVLLFNSSWQDPVQDTREILRRRIEELHNQPAGPDTIGHVGLVSAFYEANGFELQWTCELLNKLTHTLAISQEEGLCRNDYHYHPIRQHMDHFRQLGPEQLVSLELLATDAFLKYASHLTHGKVDAGKLGYIWQVKEEKDVEPLVLLQQAISEQSMRVLMDQRPHNDLYRGLRKALSNYRKIRMQEEWAKIIGSQSLNEGGRGMEVRSLKLRLLGTGDLQPEDTADVYVFDSSLTLAVKKFQYRHGLTPDGSIGRETLNALNIPVEERIQQIRMNMERCRWLPGDFGSYYLLVNIADFSLSVYRDGLETRHHRVIVGKNYRKTPVFSSRMLYLVLNPSWTIPPNMLRQDILPAVRKSVDYLEKNNIRIYGPAHRQLNPDTINWSRPHVLSYTFRQLPGGNNSLGAVKFMFPNKYLVYMHDTPSRDLFERSIRTFSSGCIRVEHALELAVDLLQGNPSWDPEKVQRVVQSGITQTVPLKDSPDVYLLYLTCWMDSQGRVHFRNDVYNRDPAVLDALGICHDQ